MTTGIFDKLQPPGKLLLTAAAVIAAAANMRAQGTPQTGGLPHFEAASVKLPADQNILETRPKRSIGRFRWTTTLSYLLEYAYHLEGWRISGIPASDPICAIVATSDPKASEEQVRLMVQSLLIDRFKMSVHTVTREATGYALTLAKGGPKMQEAKEGEIPALPDWLRGPSADPAGMEELVVATLPSKGVGAITGRRATTLQLTEKLQRLLGTAVLDQTGLSGKYYFALQYPIEDDADAPYANLAGAMKELGLKLEKHKGPVEMLVVDHIEKIPTEN